MSLSYFVSDIHIKEVQGVRGQQFLHFLHRALNNPSLTHLFLVGDIFDLWIAHHDLFIQKYQRIIKGVGQLVERGIEVHYFEGNHDLYLKSFWQGEMGVKVHDGPQYFSLWNQQVRVEHGDLMNPEDRAYLIQRSFLKSSLGEKCLKHLPANILQSLGQGASRLSRFYGQRKKKWTQNRIQSFMRSYAEKSVKQKFFDFFISGHTHLQDEYEFQYLGQKVKAINLGSWFNGPGGFFLSPGGHGFMDWPCEDF